MAFQSFEDEQKKKEAESLAAQMTAATPKAEEDAGYEMSSNDLISQAILQIAPSILGAAIGGSGGAQVGIKAGQEGIKSYTGIKEAAAKQELAKNKLAADRAKAQQEAQFKAAELGIKKHQIEAKGSDADQLADLRKLDIQERMLARKEKEQEKDDEKRQALETQFGLAKTKEDAKDIKAASETKESFDAKIQELIDLRKEYGGEVANREAVGRARQLSKDLLLAYKNMAKLGVLSQSDEAILNEIIPSDPLEFKLSGIVGQDPIMTKLQSFQQDVNQDFQNKLKNRLRMPEEGIKMSQAKDGKPEKTVIKKGYNPKTNKTQLIYSDGSKEVLDGKV